MRICTQKTKTPATLPLSEEALSYCGEPSRGPVFKGLSLAHTREPFKSWLNAAGITKKITFHSLRHPYATLLITNGTDIYSVSKMLSHKNVATTQICAEVVNQKKRDAANSITLKSSHHKRSRQITTKVQSETPQKNRFACGAEQSEGLKSSL